MSVDVANQADAIEPMLDRAFGVLQRQHPGSRWAVGGAPLECRKSTVLPLVEHGGQGRAGLKIYSEARAAERQAAGLQYAAAMNAFPGYGAPVLYDHDAEAGSLLVEWVQAPHLEQVLVRSAASPSAHCRTIERVGDWLRAFHALGGTVEGEFDSARYRSQLNARMVSATSGLETLRLDPLWVRSVDWLESELDRVDGTLVPLACTHGDFTFTNVLVSRDRVTGIDIWADRWLPLAEDLARMFVYLAMGDLFPLRARLGPVPLDRRRAQRALLAGYGGLDSRSMTVWEVLVCFEALARWLSLSDRLARRESPTERWKRAGVRGVLTSIVGRG
jgi:aminoglycoside phosphotransferase (APT) family kinase protein